MNISKMKPFDKIEVIRKCTGFTATQKLILFVLASHHGKNSFCFLGYSTLHLETGLSESTIRENLALLINHEIVFKKAPEGNVKSNRYAINFEILVNKFIHKGCRVAAGGVPPGDTLPAARTTRGCRQATPKRNINKIKEIEITSFVSDNQNQEQKAKSQNEIKNIVNNLARTMKHA